MESCWRKNGIEIVLLIVSLLVLGISPLEAQIVNDGESLVLSDSTNVITGDVTVGTNGAFTLLVLSDNTLLTNSGNGLISRNANAKSNQVQLISPTALWHMNGRLFVGSNGSTATLIVSNGALVRANDSVIGFRTGSDSNLVLVSGSGSTLSNAAQNAGTGLTLGLSSSGNRLVVSNGGWVVNANGGGQIGNIGSNNVALVTGAGSVWSNRFSLRIGVTGSANVNNRLLVEDGGQVFNDDAIIGGNNGSTSNFAFITGNGSLWNNRDIYTGDGGRSALMVSNAATVLSRATFLNGDFNQFLVTGSGSAWSNENDLAVGTGGARNALLVSNGGWVANSNAFVGGLVPASLSANDNIVTVTGPGSVWTNQLNVFLGFAGARNQLVVSNGARVVNFQGVLGFGSSSTDNHALVTGVGSIWTNRGSLRLGEAGARNRLVVADGGHLHSSSCDFGEVSSSSNNEAVVTGPGSLWAMPNSSLDLGISGSRNRLVITNGGSVRSAQGLFSVGEVSSNNEAVVTGPGSSWTNLGPLRVGLLGRGSRLLITNGAVVSSTEVILGDRATSTGNRVVVDGGTLSATNATVTGALDVRRGTNILNAGLIDVDQLRLTNLLGKFQFNGGTLITRSAFFNNNEDILMGSGPVPAIWDVRAGPTNHFAQRDLFVGYQGSFCQLLVTNGAFLTNGSDVFVGEFPGANSNATIVAGTGSKLVTRGDYYLGEFGAFNRLVVSNGASLIAEGTRLGLQTASSNNQALVTGANALFKSQAEMRIGDGGSGNKLIVADGGTTANNIGSIGYGSTSDNNEVLVTDPGSVWSSATMLLVGRSGRGNRLNVNNGGSVISSSAVIGDQPTSINSVAVVAGGGSLWTNSRDLTVGRDGDNSMLFVTNGGTVVTSNAFMGITSGGNRVFVDESGSRLQVQNALQIGSSDAGNQLLLSNGGFLESSNAFIGFAFAANFNAAYVSGAGTVWSNQNSLTLGHSGHRNVLLISDGAVVLDTNAFIGFNSGSVSNEARITGSGSLWSSVLDTTVGYSGARNQLTIDAGGTVRDRNGFIGFNPTGSNNLVVVSDPGSLWTNQTVVVGFGGSGNQLVVTNDGLVVAALAVFVGLGAGSTNNRIVVDGGTLRTTNSTDGLLNVLRGTNVLNAGLIDVNQLLVTNTQSAFEFNGGTLVTRSATISNGVPFLIGSTGATPAIWDVRNGLHVLGNYLAVGDKTSFNQLRVTNGATAIVPEVLIGFASSANSNTVAVAGAGSRCQIAGEFVIGLSSSFNSLVVSNGGFLASGLTDFSDDFTASNNLAIVTGPGSVWSNRLVLNLGRVGSDNRLLINDSALVSAGDALFLGSDPLLSSNNLLHVKGGTLHAQNMSGTAMLNIRAGMNLFDGGRIETDRLVVTNARGFFQFNSGILRSANTTIGNGRAFTIGNGTDDGTFELLGNTHTFSDGLVVANHSSLAGSGSVSGALTVQPGGTLAPGASIGVLALSNAPVLQGTIVMEISKQGLTTTNDQIQVTGQLTYGGSLIVSNLAATAFSPGDRFPLFTAGSFAGSFATLLLPPLPSGLSWANRLLVDGSIEVVTITPPTFGSFSLTGTNLTFAGNGGAPNTSYAVLTATNVALPLNAWVGIATNQFDSAGGFMFTTGVTLSEPMRFFTLEAR